MAESLLEKDFLSRLEYLYIVTRELFTGHISAERMSKKFGVGMEFADHRSYAPGDDFRYLDWTAFARRGDLQIKLFTEEQAADIYIVVDASLSMTTGEPEKLYYAKKIAAALGYIGLANLDPVTVAAFDVTLREARTFRGRGQLQRMIAFLDGVKAGGESTSMGGSFQEFIRRFPAHGVVILLSDFLDRTGYEETIRLLHYNRHDLIAVQVNSREEIEPAFTGDLELVDAENSQRTMIQMTPALLDNYKLRFEEHYGELSRLCKQLRRQYVPVITDMPFEDVIFDLFRRGGFLK